MSGPRLCGLVLAAGAGRRFGGPKALAREPDGTPWITRAVEMLRTAACADVLVALGASADEAVALVPAGAVVVRVPNWRDGVGASLRAGLDAAAALAADAIVVTPVDTPDAAASAVRRVVGVAGADPVTALAQAVYDGRPGHPVLIGRAHWAALAATVAGDVGARPYLVTHDVLEVECDDLWSGADIDSAPRAAEPRHERRNSDGP